MIFIFLYIYVFMYLRIFARCMFEHAGASMVKWTNKVHRYITTIIILVKGLKVVAMCCSNWIIFIMTFVVVLNTQM
jgi:hypothetical protein